MSAEPERQEIAEGAGRGPGGLEGSAAEQAAPGKAAPAAPQARAAAQPGLSAWQRLRRWLLGAAVLLAAGFLAAVFSLYLPARQAAQKAQAEAQQARQAAAAQATQDAGRIAELQPAAEQASRLEAELRQEQARSAALRAQVDVAAAQLALQKGDAAAAQTALAGAAQRLEELQKLVPAAQAPRLEALLARLELALGEIETDAYAAQSDLDVLMKGLQQLETAAP